MSLGIGFQEAENASVSFKIPESSEMDPPKHRDLLAGCSPCFPSVSHETKVKLS